MEAVHDLSDKVGSPNSKTAWQSAAESQGTTESERSLAALARKAFPKPVELRQCLQRRAEGMSIRCRSTSAAPSSTRVRGPLQ
jgi:hypothetical protein